MQVSREAFNPICLNEEVMHPGNLLQHSKSVRISHLQTKIALRQTVGGAQLRSQPLVAPVAQRTAQRCSAATEEKEVEMSGLDFTPNTRSVRLCFLKVVYVCALRVHVGAD